MVKRMSIIIVTWNVREHLEANLRRLFSLSYAENVEVFVVDNGSMDGSAAMVREQFPHVTLIQNDWDAGFAGPNNQAARLATGEVLLFLNPDMLLEEGTLEKTYETLMNDPTIGVMSVKLIGANGKPIRSVRRLPQLRDQLAVVLKLARVFPKWNASYMYDGFDYNKSQDVESVRGSYFAFRRAHLNTIGFWDDGFHLWFEEVDYCQRFKKAGLRVYHCAEVSCTDYVGRGFAKMKHLEKQRIFTASMVRYFKKWQPAWQTAIIMAARPFGICMAWLADVYEAFVPQH